MKTELMLVTPEMAKKWLASNYEGQRSLMPSVVARYARDMREGAWRVTGSPIQISVSGKLLDGQHRLQALAMLTDDQSVALNVSTDVPEEAFGAIDRGTGRKYADQLRWSGEKYIHQLSATLTKACGFEKGMGDRGKWSISLQAVIRDTDRQRYLDQHPEIRYSVDKWGNQTDHTKATGGTQANVLGLAHHLIETACDRGAADWFMRQLITQDREAAAGTIRSAVRALGQRTTPEERLAIILAAWNHWSVGREVTTIRLAANFRENMPTINSRISRG